jgi:RNA polymerase sigma factor (TIGR02999 family)
MDESAGEITLLLKAYGAGDRDAFDAVVGRVHDELRAIARRQLRGLHAGQTLDTGALVNEAYLRLAAGGLDASDRNHFFGIAARVMRLVIVDHIRERVAQKRGAGVVWTTLGPEVAGEEANAEVVLAVNRAVEKLATFNERLARVVECRFFGGMREEEIAGALGVSLRSVERDWKKARAWLGRELGTA